MKRTVAASDALADWGSFGPKAHAMVLLLRYSGLRMQDAACLERKRLNDGRLFLYTQKTGTPVYLRPAGAAGRPVRRQLPGHPQHGIADTLTTVPTVEMRRVNLKG